jgi:glycosyltransferase involved in cell wall biosynthesis
MSITSRARTLVALTSTRGARLHADGRRLLRGSWSAVPAGLGDVRRTDHRRWVDKTAAMQEPHRLAVEPISAPVAVICSSHRPEDLETVIASVRCQTHTDVELIFVAHGEHWDLAETAHRLGILEARGRAVEVLAAPASVSLGACLNLALTHTDARFVAKFDGDDRYGPLYLEDSLRAHAIADAGIVGKHTYYSHLVEQNEYILRFPGHEFQYTSTMSGGTFVIDRDIVDDQRFADVWIGEDRDFIHRCHRRGISTYSGDRFNYTVVRSGNNTWKIDDDQFTASSIRYPAGWDPAQIDR